jgi:hypothetical protein
MSARFPSLVEIISRMRYVSAGDIVEADDHNSLVDAVKCIRDILNAVMSLVFDYVIDIYPDRIVVTGSDGSTVTLYTIGDLNSWLGNVRGKRIRINACIEVADDLRLTQNEYFIFGRRFRGNILLREKNITIISFTQLGHYYITPEGEEVETFVTNYDPDTGTYLDVSGLRLFSVYANLDIEGTAEAWLTNVVVHVMFAYDASILYLEGDVFLRSLFASIGHVKLGNAHIEVLYNLSIGDVRAVNSEGVWYIVSYNATHIFDTIDTANVSDSYMVFYFSQSVSLDPGATGYIDLGILPTSFFINVLIVHYGAEVSTFVGQIIRTLDPTGIVCKVDVQNKRIVVTNDTSATQMITVIWVVKAYG